MAKEKTAQEYLIKSKLYRIVSLVFVTIGVIIFAIMYIQNVEGRLMQALKDPATIAIFLIPFIPAAIMSLLADSAEKKYKKMSEASKDAPKKG